MNRSLQRILSFVLCFVMLAGYLPVSARAEEALPIAAPVAQDAAQEAMEAEVVIDELTTDLIQPVETVPATTAPTETVPETTVPEAAVPETTAPQETVPETTETEETVVFADEILEEDMLVGLADSEPIYILAGGDFQEAGDHANSAANVTNILAQISQKYTTMDGFLFIGDYDCETHDSATETANGITALMGAVQGKYSNLNDANSVLAQGNHDYMDSRIDTTGGHEFDGYAAYVLNEDDYPNGGGSQTGIQTLANNLKTWLNNKIGEGYSQPIFIVSHLPLAFTPRTVTQGDAKYAKYIFDVLNDAGKNGLNIVFLHGHDHAYGPDNYMGGEAIYLPVGDKICIAEAGSTSAWTEETLNFTYMNAGYTGYYSDPYTYVTTAGTDKLTMTVFAIENDKVTVERYSANGQYNLKSAGYDGSYSNTSVTNESLGLPTYSNVYTSPQTIKLTVVSTGDEVGTIGNYVAVSNQVDDVTPSGNKWVTIKAATNGSAGSDPTYQYVLDTDGIDYGETNKYIIVDDDQAIALHAPGTSNGTAHNITISGNTATLDTRDYEYHMIRTTYNGTRYELITKGDGSQYLYQEGNGVRYGTRSSVKFQVNHHGSGVYDIHDIDGTNWYIIYNGGWTVTETTSARVRLYKYDKTIPGTDATPGSNGVYGYLEGKLSYVVPSGTSAADALSAVKSGIAIKYSNYSDYSNVGDFDDDGEGMTWTLDPSYNGTPGDYAVTIAYNGTVLGVAEVIVPAPVVYYGAEGNGLYTVAMNTSAADALAAVKAGITVYSADDINGTNKTPLEDSQVTWNWVDKYDGTNYGPYTVEILYGEVSLGTVEVKVNVQYDTGINAPVYIGTESAGYKYVLDTDGMDPGSDNRYIVVGDDEAIMLTLSDNSVSYSSDVTITGNTATTTTRNHEFYFQSNNGIEANTYLLTRNGSSTVYHGGGNLSYGSHNRGYWYVNHTGNGEYQVYDYDNLNWYLNYGIVWENESVNRFSVSSTSSNHVRLYKYTGYSAGGNIYAYIEGNTVYTVEQGKSATTAMNIVKTGITGYLSNNADGSNATELDDSQLTWTWKNKFNGNVTGSYWVEISYQGKVLGTVEIRVEPGVVNNYPEYPDEGAVKVNKTGTGIDFQSSGIAQVEVSASGVPIKKGVDVIVMLDTSSSMTSHTVTGTSKTRAQVLEESLVDLIAQFKTPGDDGELLDIRVAIADFNGFYGENHSTSGTPYDRDAADMMSDDISYNANSEAQVYTGNGTLTSGAFVDAAELANTYTLNYTSGTNYDYAMDAIYQLGTSIKEANGNEERDLYVIFMSDGAAMQWNYYHSQGASSLWNNWICGNWAVEDLDLNCDTHAYYYNDVDTDGDGMRNEHRMANAIKGDPDSQYEVIRKTDTLGTPTDETNMYMVPGLGATLFSISFDAQTDDQVTEASMDLSIETLASEQTGTTKYYYKVTSAGELSDAFSVIGTEIAYAASNARFVDQMGDSYNLQMAVSNYTVVNDDKTTTDKTITPKIEIISYDIYTRQDFLNGTITADKIGDRKGTYTILETVTFNATGTQAYSDQINGGQTNILADGTQTGYVKGVIYAKTFLYNTNVSAVSVEGVSIPTGTKADGTTTGTTNLLPSETFYWKMGTVQTSELAMRYYVYLEGSMEGTCEGGSYPTNEFATLYYDNYLGNPCKKDTVSPVLAWKQANVSYAFYLVNENGEIIVNQTTGQTGSFANKIAVTNPVVYETILLNNLDQIRSIEVASATDGILPTGYELYDTSSVYTITINSNTTGSWEIQKGNDKVASTYVMQYDKDDSSAYSNALLDGVDASGSTVVTGHDYTHTVVWFAVLWKVQALPDSVVIDYGLPVDISVLANDMFGENGKLAGVGPYYLENGTNEALLSKTGDSSLAADFASSYEGTYGVATADASTGKVRYTLNTSNGMQMSTYEKFVYAVNYTGTSYPGYYYDTVTVIPATSIYYEDSFLTLKGSGTEWEDEGTAIEGATQDEDRPGKYSLTDANNIYGYDAVNLGMSTYSLGTAKKVHVGTDSYATAEFTFAGTGFDVISMTSNKTGTIAVDVYATKAVTVKENVYNSTTGEYELKDNTYSAGDYIRSKSGIVNTYYGYTSKICEVTYTYTKNEWVKTVGAEVPNGTINKVVLTENPEEGTSVTGVEQVWIATPDEDNALYQIPVLQVEDLPYSTYKVVLTATYIEPTDLTTEEGYWLYLDAVRIYDPANDGAADGTTDTTIEDAYKADGEGWPSYIELRNKLIAADSFDNVANDALTEDMEGLVFIDGDASVGDAQISDYTSYGPNNEVYLAPGQRVAFLLNVPTDNIANIHIGIKSADGKAGTYTITNIAKATNNETGVTAGDYYNAKTYPISTTTDMYYDLTGWKDNIIVISNTGDKYDTTGIISLTNIKSTYTSAPASGAAAVSAYSLRSAAAELSEPAETTIYMTPAAATLTLRSINTQEPLEDTPGSNVPETTVPEETVPETTEPEETEPEETKPGKPNKPSKPSKPAKPAKPGNQNQTNKPDTQEIVETIRNVLDKLLRGWFK